MPSLFWALRSTYLDDSMRYLTCSTILPLALRLTRDQRVMRRKWYRQIVMTHLKYLTRPVKSETLAEHHDGREESSVLQLSRKGMTGATILDL